MATCTHCSREVSPNARVCPGCGEPDPSGSYASARLKEWEAESRAREWRDAREREERAKAHIKGIPCLVVMGFLIFGVLGTILNFIIPSVGYITAFVIAAGWVALMVNLTKD
jgi:hypothetical protein